MQLAEAMSNVLADAFDTQISTGSTYTGGRLVFQAIGTAGTTDIVTIVANEPMFGAAASRAIALGTSPAVSGTAGATATLNRCTIQTRAGTDMAVLGCGTAGSPDFTLSSLSISSGETLTVNSLTITVAAGSLAFGT